MRNPFKTTSVPYLHTYAGAHYCVQTVMNKTTVILASLQASLTLLQKVYDNARMPIHLDEKGILDTNEPDQKI